MPGSAQVSYYTVTPPENFNFRHPDAWPKWKTRFDRYRSISGLSTRDDPSQIDALLYTMGEGAEDIFSSLKLTTEERLSYSAVALKLDGYFLPKRNVIFERARFNRRCQESHETVDTFVTDLHKLADTCDFGTLRDDLIRDRVVVGLLDLKLSETLQLDSALTLETALTKARSSEAVKKQQLVLRSNDGKNPASGGGNVDTLSARRVHPQQASSHPNRPNQGAKPKGNLSSTLRTICNWCGSDQSHAKKECPAYDKVCSSCNKKGHYARVCKSAGSYRRQPPPSRGQPSRGPAHLEEVFIGSICGESWDSPWFIDARLGDALVSFKIDTGADVTVIPDKDYRTLHTSLTELRPPDKVLLTPARQPLDTLGYFEAPLTIHGRSSLQRIYVVRDLQQSLMGRPAIQALGVLAKIFEFTSAKHIGSSPPRDPRKLFPSLFSGLGCLGNEHEYNIELKPHANPFAVTTPRRVPIPLFPKVKAELARMEELGVIKQVREATEWCAPMVIARKREGEIRICCSFEELNRQLIRERTVMPTVDESLAQLSNAKVFSKIDGRWGFWQIPLAKESQKLTTFITPFGRYMYLRLPFGISSAPEHFQRVMSQLLEGLPGQVCQLDDILIHGHDRQNHDEHLFPILERLQKSGLTLNASKCEFFTPEVAFLGHVLTPEGISADPRKTQAILDMKPPTDVRGVRAFLGMVNHLAKFLPDLSNVTKPLRDLLRADTVWTWGQPQQKAFSQIQRDLSQPPVLALYDPSRPLTVSADASSYGLGGVLLQEDHDGKRRPVAYASRSITDTERRYAQVEKEALASVWACARFRSYLVGLQFTIETDHKPLLAILDSKRLDELTPRLQRLRMKLMEYTYKVTYVPGKEMYTADVLSRSPVDEMDTSDSDLPRTVEEYEIMAIELLPFSDSRLTEVVSEQKRDPMISQVRDFCVGTWPVASALSPALKSYAEVSSDLSLVQGVLLKGSRVVVPASLREDILEKLHEGHQGITRTRARALQSVWWPGISSQIADYVRSCSMCGRYRCTPTEPLLSTPLPDRPWQMVGADLFEGEHRHYLVVVDYFSRFFELEKLSSTTSEAIIDRMKFIFARHGIPECVRSDNGPQFSSGEFAQFCREYGVRHITSSPRYPQSNGEAERMVQTAKNIIRKSDLAKGLLAYRSTPTVAGPSPAELLYGRKIRSTVPTLPTELDPRWPDLQKFREADRASKAKQADYYNVRHRASEQPSLPPGSGVWTGGQKATVVRQEDTPRSYTVETKTGTLRRTRSHLQPVPPDRQPVQVPLPPPGISTRSGRVVRPPQRLGL